MENHYGKGNSGMRGEPSEGHGCMSTSTASTSTACPEWQG